MGCDLHGRGLLGTITIFVNHPAAPSFTPSKANIIASDCPPSSAPLVLAQDDQG